MDNFRVDSTTKIFLLLFVVVLTYFLVSLVITPFFVKQPQTMRDMMTGNFSQQALVPNVLALLVALGAGLLASLQLKTSVQRPVARTDRQKALSIVKKKLSDDERKMLGEIERTGAITQDSLRARLGWSKAKISTTVTRLDRMDLIQRERQGKTYRVFLSKDLK